MPTRRSHLCYVQEDVPGHCPQIPRGHHENGPAVSDLAHHTRTGAYPEAIGYKNQCGWSLCGSPTATEDSEDKAEMQCLAFPWAGSSLPWHRSPSWQEALPDCLMVWDLVHSHPVPPQLSTGLRLSQGSLLSSDSVFPVHWPRLWTAHLSLEKNEHRDLAQGSRPWG